MTPVRWGVLGVARVFERRMAPAFAAIPDAAQLVAIGSRSPEKAQAAAARHQITRALGSYEAVLADPDVEAVYIPLPNDQHAAWSLRALAAGKHVLCDKPAALSFADAQAMAVTAQQADRRLMEGFMFRHHPQHARVAQIIASGVIGMPVHFRGAFTYSADANRDNIRWRADQGGGAFFDVGVYAVNAARLLFGAEPVAVSAVAIMDEASGVDRHVVGVLEFAGGRTAVVEGGFDQAFASRYEIVGPGGTITAERAFQIGEAGVSLSIRDASDAVATETFPHLDQYAQQIAHFSRCVREPARPLWPGENGVAQARVVEAFVRSVAHKRRVEIAEVTA